MTLQGQRLESLCEQLGLYIPNVNDFSVFSDVEYVVPARSELQTKSNLSSGNL